jgi:hypothetical protein
MDPDSGPLVMTGASLEPVNRHRNRVGRAGRGIADLDVVADRQRLSGRQKIEIFVRQCRNSSPRCRCRYPWNHAGWWSGPPRYPPASPPECSTPPDHEWHHDMDRIRRERQGMVGLFGHGSYRGHVDHRLVVGARWLTRKYIADGTGPHQRLAARACRPDDGPVREPVLRVRPDAAERSAAADHYPVGALRVGQGGRSSIPSLGRPAPSSH